MPTPLFSYNTEPLGNLEIQKVLAQQIDVDALYEDFPGGVPAGCTERLSNFFWLGPEGFSKNLGCAMNSLATMNVDCHLKELQQPWLIIDGEREPNPIPCSTPSVPQARGRGKILMWLTNKLYECLQNLPGTIPALPRTGRPEQPWSNFPNFGLTGTEMFNFAIPCKCEVMKDLGFTMNYKITVAGAGQETRECGKGGSTIGTGSRKAWPPACPCVVGDTITIMYQGHAFAARILECKKGVASRVAGREHPYQGGYSVHPQPSSYETPPLIWDITPDGRMHGHVGSHGVEVVGTVCSTGCVTFPEGLTDALGNPL